MKKLALILLCWLPFVPSLAEATALDDNILPAFDGCRAVRYRLVEGSLLIDNRGLAPAIIAPIRGSFWLRPVGQDPLFWHFALRHLRFAGTGYGFPYTGRGRGRYKLGGEFALTHQMTLAAGINEVKDVPFDSGLVVVQAPLPWIEIDLTEVFPDPNFMPYRFFQLHLVAVPWPVMWFSTEHGFHMSGSDDTVDSYISDGDLLSPTGTVIRTNRELTRRLGIMPVVPDLGLDAVLGLTPTISPHLGPARGEIWFSTEEDAFSESLGELLQDGDLLSEAGRIIRHNADFITPFSPIPPLIDYGLDAVTPGPNGLLLFSTEQSFFSQSLGVSVGDGDLLCEDGTIFKRVGDLLAHFQPIEPRPIPFGLDAAYLWPHGEVWFSIEVGFADARFGYIGDGDLLSDTGRVVVRNLELLEAFRPVEDLTDFGLDALHLLWPPLTTDLDLDGDTDLADYATFAGYWQQTDCGDCGGADFTGDGKVTSDDLREFAGAWLTGVE